jgi:hypothetical protein
MRLVSNYLAATLSIGLTLSGFSAQLSAQQVSDPEATLLLPEATRPQLAQADSSAQQLPGEHSQDSQPPSSGTLQQDLGGISGTVTDLYGDLLPGATVTLDGQIPADHHQIVANDNGAFAFDGLRGNASYRITVSRDGFVTWTSAAIMLAPDQHVFLSGVVLKIEGEQASVTVYASTAQIAVEQVRIEEQQRVLGFIPNFYVVYDSKNAVPLTAKLKFKLALRVSIDPVTIGGVAFMAGIDQAANTPDYIQGAKGYGQRIGAVAADSFSDILIGGAILPSLLHQDPRYFYQGTGTTQSRLRHALFSPFICRGDNGRWQPNYSSVGGDLASSAISNVYYPQSNRGAGLVFGNFAIGTAERMASGFAQEFIFRRFTPAAKDTGTQAH